MFFFTQIAAEAGIVHEKPVLNTFKELIIELNYLAHFFVLERPRPFFHFFLQYMKTKYKSSLKRF